MSMLQPCDTCCLSALGDHFLLMLIAVQMKGSMYVSNSSNSYVPKFWADNVQDVCFAWMLKPMQDRLPLKTNTSCMCGNKKPLEGRVIHCQGQLPYIPNWAVHDSVLFCWVSVILQGHHWSYETKESPHQICICQWPFHELDITSHVTRALGWQAYCQRFWPFCD